MLLAAVTLACNSVNVSPLYRHGAVATTSPVASEVGRQVFIDGGNAYDVAVAVGFALAVAYPQAGNLGGGGFAVVRDGRSGRIQALDFRETAPGSADETMYLDDTGAVIPGLSTYGARACGVPGSVAGLYELWRDRGALEWSDLVLRAARLADTGFLIDEFLAGALSSYRVELSSFPETAAIFLPGGALLKPGDRLVQKDLARTLYRIAEEGPGAFYQGPIAVLIDSCMRRHGGLITLSDLQSYVPVWREPVHFVFDSLDVYSSPPPSSGGIAVGQILTLLEPYDFSRYNPASPEYMHLFCEASRLVFADRAEHLGDPGFYDVPEGLVSEAYLAARRELIQAGRAGSSQNVAAGRPPHGESDETTHYSVCDGDGNMVAVTTTINTSFGSKLVVEGAGFLLNNEMDDFAIKPGFANTYGLVGSEANKIEPGKRMLSSMAPTLVLRQGEPFLITGSPGGSRIITTVAQSILNYTRFGLPLADAIARPRFHHQWLPDVVYLEEGGYDVAVMQTLIKYGHNLEERSAYGDLQMIAVDAGGFMQAASDPRQGGAPAGY
ncbi:MAG TPA: gamma-glutamyltransferase [Acidobacteriota bacterium]|nr:gamma-glutamyltransferase [Acidobacteriota bacterium]